jgi:hypothetical protein
LSEPTPPSSDPPSDAPHAPRPRQEVTSLVELEAGREQLRKNLRIWHLFLPASGDDVRAYRSLMRFVAPYRGKLLLSILLALVSAIFVTAELGILQGALSKILNAPTPAELAKGRRPRRRRPRSRPITPRPSSCRRCRPTRSGGSARASGSASAATASSAGPTTSSTSPTSGSTRSS